MTMSRFTEILTAFKAFWSGSVGISVGDLVEQIPGSYEYPLASGAILYKDAVVVSVSPFVLVSRETDMMWSEIDPADFRVTGRAGRLLLQRCRRRLPEGPCT